MLVKGFLFALLVAVVISDKARVDVLEHRDPNGDEHEIISIDLQKRDGSEDIKLIAQLRFHLVEGIVHLNGTRLFHNVVNSVHMRLQIVEIKRGSEPTSRMASVHVRVLVLETTNANGNKILTIEEEFVQVEEYEVIQVKVLQVVWESMVRKPVSIISLKESRVHKMPRESDKHIMVGEPHHPHHGLEGEDYQHHHHCHHHHHHHHGNNSHHGVGSRMKCWYHHLSWKAKLSLFSVGFLSVVALVLCCVLYKRRRQHRRTLRVSAPIDDSVAVDMDDVKKFDRKKDEKYDFHFEFDNTVVVDDKKALVEE